jgi:hypothetical protein
MASRLRRAISSALTSLLTATSLVLMPTSPAQALESTTGSSCLIINDQHELVSADFCTGDIVIPASVRTIKSYAFVYFEGAVSFEANSQLATVQSIAFFSGFGTRSIIFPPSLTSIESFAVASSGNNVIYFEGSPAQVDSNAIWQSGNFTLIRPRGLSINESSFTSHFSATPFQIDCNAIDGGKDFVGTRYVALELHNCKDPRNPSASNPPATMAYILNQGLNDAVALQSADGNHHGLVRLRQLGDSGMRLAFTREIDGSAFSESVFGDEFAPVANSTVTCTPFNGTPLPTGVTLTRDCKLEASSTSALASSTTDITVNWSVEHGTSNCFDVAASSAPPTAASAVTGSIGIRLSLRKLSQLTAGQLFDMKLLTARYSGTSRDWTLAIDSYRALPSSQVPAGTPNAGIAAASAVEQFESGTISEASATAAVDAFANEAAPGSTQLSLLRSRIELKSVANLVTALETTGARARKVRQRILDLPASSLKDDLWSRFEARTNTLFAKTSSVAGSTRTLVYANPYRVEEFTVPVGVTQLTIQIQGAEGSQGGEDTGNPRPERVGFKGQVAGVIAVVPGQRISIGVGEAAGDPPVDCLAGLERVALDTKVARGGTNPFGGYAGGNGGTPGIDGCSGYGGAGGAATVVKVGSDANLSSTATLVAGGAAGSSGSSDGWRGQLGLATFTSRSDAQLTSGQSGRALWSYTFPEFYYDPSDGGALAGAGGGAIGGAIGEYDLSRYCGWRDYCPLSSSPGSNSTGSLAGLTGGYVPYAFDDQSQANGKVTISFLEPSSSANPVGSGGTGDGTDNPTPTPTSTPTPGAMTSDAPTDIKVVPLWKGAEVSWKAPSQDGGSPITGYEVTASNGQTCKTKKLNCRIAGLKPGQLIQVLVTAKHANGLSGPPARPAGPKVFTPLSLNLWQVKLVDQKPKVKPIPARQLTKLRAMLVQDVGGFTVTVKVAKNSSKFSAHELRRLLAAEVKVVTDQLEGAHLIGKVRIETSIVSGNLRAKHPSVVISSRNP